MILIVINILSVCGLDTNETSAETAQQAMEKSGLELDEWSA